MSSCFVIKAAVIFSHFRFRELSFERCECGTNYDEKKLRSVGVAIFLITLHFVYSFIFSKKFQGKCK